ncbi:lipoprotein insertase outer membrane protein LolB [Arsukibacterium indicum]|uniref:Outer-membrane lipoprotein LolB n=1 Tax=Arsukibacterium indicum TaxID=2848612 RepID=A0ABS6MHH3_9GAMM|nr:lipoprotein insertase outer membrane protein LolB [Arsukibacterium indicum]MBV2128262.1 lipoprotein insertase outer membrane protein LolB [Arsukibacterium indicum]
MSATIKWFTLAGLLLLTSGCSLISKPAPVQALDNKSRLAQINAINEYTVQASVGIKTPDESVSGNLTWQQLNTEHYKARLANFLGISLFELTNSEQGSSIMLRGERYQAADTSSLLWQLAGWSMPLADMPLWLKGIPGQAATAIEYDELGRVNAFQLVDSTGIIWQLRYQSFFADELALPKKISLISDDTTISFYIRSWQL